MNRQAFDSFTKPWPMGLRMAAIRLRSPVAKRIDLDPAALYLAQLNYRTLEREPHPQPPRQLWCSYPQPEGSAFIITSPKPIGRWSNFDNVGLLLGGYMELLLLDEPGFTSSQVDTPDAYSYIVGPTEFVRTTALEWISA